MKTATYLCLSRLHARHGEREFGKICQKLVALAFRHGGFTHVVERGVQGVDIDAAADGKKYTAEIKTTTASRVVYLPKDAEGLASRSLDGYLPLIGVLRLSALSDWYLVDAVHLLPGVLRLECLRPYRCRDLEGWLQSHFESVVDRHFEGALSGSQAYLDQVLRQVEEAPAC